MLRRRLVQLALGACVVMVVGGTMRSISSTSPPPPPVTSEVTRGVVLASVSATGNISAPDQLAVDFGSGGRLTELLVRAGDPVRRGQPLARIDDAPAREELAGARADLAAARAELLVLTDGLTPEELTQARAAVDSARTSVDHAAEEIAAAEQTRTRQEATREAVVDQARADLASAEETARHHAETLRLAVEQAEADLAFSRGRLAEDEARLAADRRLAAAALHEARVAWELLDLARQLARDIEAEMRAEECDTMVRSSSAAEGDAKVQEQDDKNRDKEKERERRKKRRCDELAAHHAEVMDAIADHQDDLNRAESDLIRFEGYIREGERAVLTGRAQVFEDEHALARALDQQEAGEVEDGRNLQAARAALDDALNALADGRLADEQAVERARQNLASSRASLRTSEADQAVKAQPPTAAQLGTREAAVQGARARVEAAERTLAETTLRSPVNGTVAVVDAKAGEWVRGFGDLTAHRGVGSVDMEPPGSVSGTSQGLIILTDLDALQVKGRFSEADAARIRLGQPAVVTLDALFGETVSGQVAQVDVIETVVNNVVTYEVTVLLDEAVEGVKPGMTAAVDVVVDERRGVLRLPASVVTTRDQTATVTVLDAEGVPSARSVTTGLKGDEEIEITGGLEEGDQVVVTRGGG